VVGQKEKVKGSMLQFEMHEKKCREAIVQFLELISKHHAQDRDRMSHPQPIQHD